MKTSTAPVAPVAPVSAPRARNRISKAAAAVDAANVSGGGKSRRARPAKSALPSAAEIELAVQEYERLKATARAMYEEADRLFVSMLMPGIGVGGSLVLTDGRTAKVVDNFMDKDGTPKLTAYKPCGVKRYDFQCK